MTCIATWNVNSLKVRLPQVLTWCQDARPDIIALQETKLQDENFPVSDITDSGYEVVFSGQKTYNGVAILSKTAARDVVSDLPGMDDPQRRLLAATYDDIRLVNVYVPNGQSVGSDKYQYKLSWLEKLKSFLEQQLAKYPRLVVLGDFNIAPEDRDVYDPEALREKILCSSAERQSLQALAQIGLHDTFRLTDQEEKQYSWWDYRMNGFRRNLGLRIDLILASQALVADHKQTSIDKEPRRWERPSDHTPVIAQFS